MTRQAYSNSDPDEQDCAAIQVVAVSQIQPRNQIISHEVSMSRSGSILRARCSRGWSIASPIPRSILGSFTARATCRCTTIGDHRVVCVIDGLLIVFLIGSGIAGLIHTSGSWAHCVWQSLIRRGLKLIIVKLNGGGPFLYRVAAVAHLAQTLTFTSLWAHLDAISRWSAGGILLTYLSVAA